MLAYATIRPGSETCVTPDGRDTPARHMMQALTEELRELDTSDGSYELLLAETLDDPELPELLARRTDVVWVDQLSALPPGRGTGRRVLALLLEAADSERVALALVPTPFPREGALAYGDLVEWYERHGFAAWGDGACLWLREPVC